MKEMEVHEELFCLKPNFCKKWGYTALGQDQPDFALNPFAALFRQRIL